jgi:hypothetical protein
MPNDTTSLQIVPRRLTRELRRQLDMFRGFVHQALGPRVRVRPDAEAWPVAPGRYGQLEWRGLEAAPGAAQGPARVYAYTDRSRMIARLSAVPGVYRHQVGGLEGAFWIAAEDVEGIRTVAGRLRLRVRRPPGGPRPAGFRRHAHDGVHEEAPFSGRDLAGDVAIPVGAQ